MRGDLVWEKRNYMQKVKPKGRKGLMKREERSYDGIFLVENRGIHLVLRPIHSQQIFMWDITVETVSDYKVRENNWYMTIAIDILAEQ